MHNIFATQVLLLAAQALAAPSNRSQPCKTLPEDLSQDTWNKLNDTLQGVLLAPMPPGAVCHQGQATYNATACPAVQEAWHKDWKFYIDNPIQGASPNWDNDSCWPFPELNLPCDSKGFPEYVVNATTAQHVQAGVNFARENNVRLVVKASGHDFRGRSVGPKSLSIWVRHIKGLTFHDKFEPQGGCPGAYGTGGPALTMGAGENSGSAFAEANKHNMMLLVGGAPSVGQGGYALGGGHGVLSSKFGLAADNILELQVVTPDGKLVTANACTNTDLFWGLRGGGGSTLGVVVSLTVRTFPSETWSTYSFILASRPNSTRFFDALTYLAGEMPRLSDSGLQTYSFSSNGNATVGPTFINSFGSAGTNLSYVKALLDPLARHINDTYVNDTIVLPAETKAYGSLYDYWYNNPDDSTPLGVDGMIGSRILDAKALTGPNFRRNIEAVTGPTGIQMFLVSGPGVHQFSTNSSSLLPAWRTGYVHMLYGAGWTPKNETAKAITIDQVVNNYEAGMKRIAPDTGAYMNEGDPYQKDFQTVFWGANYKRLLALKRKVDPTDVFWCFACAGSERLVQQQDGRLCTA